MLLSNGDLKDWLHRDLPRLEILLIVLASFSAPCSLQQIRGAASEAGFKIPSRWNESLILGRSKGLAIRVPAGWEITDSGKAHLRNLGVTKLSPAAVQVAVDLRKHLATITNPDIKAFIEEAIKCYEAELLRSAVVMAWLAAVSLLHREVVQKHLAAFNAAAHKRDNKWKDAVNEDGLGLLKEDTFLQCLQDISLIGKNVKEQLQAALKLRNGCGHPNSLKIGPNVVASHIETLLLNVFDKFSG